MPVRTLRFAQGQAPAPALQKRPKRLGPPRRRRSEIPAPLPEERAREVEIGFEVESPQVLRLGSVICELITNYKLRMAEPAKQSLCMFEGFPRPRVASPGPPGCNVPPRSQAGGLTSFRSQATLDRLRMAGCTEHRIVQSRYSSRRATIGSTFVAPGAGLRSITQRSWHL